MIGNRSQQWLSFDKVFTELHLQIYAQSLLFTAAPYRTKLSTELCITPFLGGFVSLIHGFSATTSYDWLLVKVKVNVKVTLRLAVYRQSVRPGVRPLETHDQRFFQLNSYGNSPYVTSSLTRWWVCLLRIRLAFGQDVTPRVWVLYYDRRSVGESVLA
jgi:hypothetical protein